MRSYFYPPIAAGFLIAMVFAVPVGGQEQAKSPFRVVFDQTRDLQEAPPPEGQKGLHYGVKFKIERQSGVAEEPGKIYQAVIYHDDKEVVRFNLKELSTILAVDISSSMALKIENDITNKRIDQARIAATAFVKGLSTSADCGLILFDDRIRPNEKIAPQRDRKPVLSLIAGMQPRGDNAYLDATKVGIDMLAGLEAKGAGRNKVLVVMTDGVDQSSKEKLTTMVALAKKKDVKIHTIGIGKPAYSLPVYSVLTLDRSESMKELADKGDNKAKITAMREAAKEFVKNMPTSAMTTILSFHSQVELPDDFSDNKNKLDAKIDSLRPEGETAMLDAAYEAICTLEAKSPHNVRKAVVVMTDGIDNKSRHRPEDVIRRAQEADVAMYMLAFGSEAELEQATKDMKKIATETKGSFHHAKNAAELIRVFEDTSKALHTHDEGIESLKQLAKETGGRYHPAENINELKRILDELSKELGEYKYVFAPGHGRDGAAHTTSIRVETTGGAIVTTATGYTAERGVVIAEMSPVVYLGFLGVLGLMLAVPAALGRMKRSTV